MKLGLFKYEITNFADEKRLMIQDVQLILLLDDVMWMSIDDMIKYLKFTRKKVFLSLEHCYKKEYIKIARQAIPFQGIKRMYCITEKGRKLVNEFKNRLI